MRKKVSLKDIAQKVGVSIASVSYVLNNQKLDRISKTLAQKIKDTATELNYRTNRAARSLKTNRTNTIGLIVSDISNSFSSSLARIIENEAEKFDYTVIFGSSDENAARSKKLLDVLLNHQVDGIIIAPAEHSEQQLEYLAENEIPFVLLDRYLPGKEISYIAIDNFKASQSLTQHLIDQGRQRIGIITYDLALVNLNERKRGYTACMQENHMGVQEDWIKKIGIEQTRQQVEDAIKQLLGLPEPVNAMLFTSNVLSLYGLKYINTLPIKVPADVAIVSFDESDAADLFYAPLTHIKQPIQQMGRLAVETLMDSIERKNKVVQVNMEAEMVIRQSSIATHP